LKAEAKAEAEKLLAMIRTLFAVVVTCAYILVVGTPFLIHAVLSKNTEWLYRVGVLGAKLALRLAGVSLVVRGLEKIPAGRAVVFMPNHQSNCEPPAIFSILPPVLVLAKQEFFRVPILGRSMVLRGFIPVDRQNRQRAIEAVEKATESLKAGKSFLVFPEGTRSPDGRLQPFKKGVFVMAIKAATPIIPISVSGGSEIMRKGEFVVHPGELYITIHDPIPTERCTLEDRDEIMERVRQSILQDLSPQEQPLEVVAQKQ
jgi:1-acyl-sn-glycerol-3-phosphate acyltransferase